MVAVFGPAPSSVISYESKDCLLHLASYSYLCILFNILRDSILAASSWSQLEPATKRDLYQDTSDGPKSVDL